MSALLLRTVLPLLLVFCAGCGLARAQAAAPARLAADPNCEPKSPPPEALKHRWGAGTVYQFPGNVGKGYTGCVRVWIIRMEGELYVESVLRLKRGRLEFYRNTEHPVPSKSVSTECTYTEGKLLSRMVQPSGTTVTFDCPDAQAVESGLEAPPDAR